VQIQAYLFFPDNCEEAIGFYRQALGAELEFLMRYKESPKPLPPDMLPPNYGDKVMHAALRVGESVLMLSDDCSGHKGFGGFSLSLSPPAVADAERLFAALGASGTVKMPLAPTFWSPAFGMLTDRFGVGWMISVPGEITTGKP
jgi:PhnB protein